MAAPASNHGSHEESDFARRLRQAKSGDVVARGELLDEYRDYLLYLSNQKLGGELKQKVAASDVVQVTLLAAHQKFSQFQGQSEAEFKGWLRTIAENGITDEKRKFVGAAKRDLEREIRLNDTRNVGMSLPDGELTPGRHAVLNEQTLMLERALAELPDHYEQVLRLRNWQELSFEEIGNQLDCSAEAARKTWYRAMTQFATLLKQKHPQLKADALSQIRAPHDNRSNN